jgi:flagellar protein FlgJ
MNPLEQINNLVTTAKTSGRTPEAQAEAIRKAAQQFEAVLLNQLTSALNSTGAADDEDALFGSDGGSGLAKQMFSEQMATTMANSGGIGLSDVIMRQFGIDAPKATGKIKDLGGAMQAVKEIRGSNSSSVKNPASLINASAKSTYVPEVFNGNADEAAIVSTFADEAARGDVDDSVKNLTLNGQYLSSTRPRIVPDYAVVAGDKPLIAGSILPVESSSAAVNFQMPVSGRVSSNFGTRFHPVDHKMKFHGGMDIAVAKGTPIGAAADGEVVFAGRKGGYGNLVIIRHPDGRESRYGHLDKINVEIGAKVSAGQNIAASGSTGKSTGPHLHFEIRENGQAVDPRKVLAKVLAMPADK